MSFVDAKNVRGEIQAVPEHYLIDFPDQFTPIDVEPDAAEQQKPSTPNPKNQPAKAETTKEH